MSKIFISYKKPNLYPTARIFKDMFEKQNDWVVWLSRTRSTVNNDLDIASSQRISEIEEDEETVEISTLEVLRSCLLLIIFASEDDVSSDWQSTWGIARKKHIPIVFITTGNVEHLQDIPYDRHFNLDTSIGETIIGVTEFVNWIQSKKLKQLQRYLAKEINNTSQLPSCDDFSVLGNRWVKSLRQRAKSLDLELLAKATNSDVELIEEIVEGSFPISELDIGFILILLQEVAKLSPLANIKYSTSPIPEEHLSLHDFIDDDTRQGIETVN